MSTDRAQCSYCGFETHDRLIDNHERNCPTRTWNEGWRDSMCSRPGGTRCERHDCFKKGCQVKLRSEPSDAAGAGTGSDLSFTELRAANTARLPQFKNRHGQPAHSEPDGSDWTPAQWLQAIVGELGEYANLRKKFERGDVTEIEFTREASKELADVQIYLDILAFQLRINMGEAVTAKFNEVSERVGSSIRLPLRGSDV